MSNIFEVIDSLSPDAMRELLRYRVGYTLADNLSERYLRNTILADLDYGLLSARDIREAAEGPRHVR